MQNAALENGEENIVIGAISDPRIGDLSQGEILAIGARFFLDIIDGTCCLIAKTIEDAVKIIHLLRDKEILA